MFINQLVLRATVNESGNGDSCVSDARRPSMISFALCVSVADTAGDERVASPPAHKLIN